MLNSCPIIFIVFWGEKCESGFANSIIPVPQDSMIYARILCTALPDAKFMFSFVQLDNGKLICYCRTHNIRKDEIRRLL
jgi:hypothetical protein